MKQSVLGHVVPLMLAYDTTHESGKAGGQPSFDFAGDANDRGPAFLGLGIERANMQASTTADFRTRLLPGLVHG